MSAPTDAERVLVHLVAAHAVKVMEAEWPGVQSHCILGTRVVLAAMQYFGVPSEPCSVVAGFMNRAAIELLNAGHPESDVKAGMNGAWGVGIGIPGDPDLPGHWNGHLVALTPHYLVDVTCGNASRPERGMVVPVFLVLRRPPDLTENYSWDLDDGVVAMYRLAEDNTRYRRSPDWHGDDRHKRAAGKVIRAVRGVVRTA